MVTYGNFSKSLPGLPVTLSRNYSEIRASFRENTRTTRWLPGSHQDKRGNLSGNYQDTRGNLPGNYQDKQRNLSGNYQDTRGNLAGNSVISGETFQEITGISGKTFQEITRISGETFQEITMISGNPSRISVETCQKITMLHRETFQENNRISGTKLWFSCNSVLNIWAHWSISLLELQYRCTLHNTLVLTNCNLVQRNLYQSFVSFVSQNYWNLNLPCCSSNMWRNQVREKILGKAPDTFHTPEKWGLDEFRQFLVDCVDSLAQLPWMAAAGRSL